MKNKMTLSLMALGLALPVMSLNAQTEPEGRPVPPHGRPGGPGGPGRPGMVSFLDTNKDLVIDQTELSAATEALKKLDLNQDHQLTLEELRAAAGRPGRPGRPAPEGEDEEESPRRERRERPSGERPEGAPDRPPGRIVPPILAALDLNSDRVIDTAEMNAAPQSLAKLDKNEDGRLTVDELRPRPGPRPGGEEGQEPRPRRERRQRD